MRDLRELETWRLYGVKIPGLGVDPHGGKGNPKGGYFLVPYGMVQLRVIASNGGGWDHISVSLEGRCPTWAEMDFIKRTFFEPNETAMQLHVPEALHINQHPYTLHLWRPHWKRIPIPPRSFV